MMSRPATVAPITAGSARALAVAVALFGCGQSAFAADAASLVARCAAAADAFLGALDPAERERAQRPFAGDERFQWTYFPNVPQLDVRTEGARTGALSASQLQAAHRLIECGLSSSGYQKTAGIMRLDDILGQTDLYRPRREGDESPVGADKYFLAVFGSPGTDGPWGWQLEGHHLALNFTAVDGEVILAPTFMGADPATVPDGPYAGWRLLGHEVDKALRLVNALDAEQRSRAILAPEIPERLFTGPGRAAAIANFAGLRAADMNPAQQRLLGDLIDEYVRNAVEPVAAAHAERIRADFPAATWFAWMGRTAADAGIYYRVHSPSLLIEFVTARNRQSKAREPNPNHVHSTLRWPGNDFGADALRRHYQNDPAHRDD